MARTRTQPEPRPQPQDEHSSGAGGEIIMQAFDVRVEFPVDGHRTLRAVDDVSLDIRRGQTVGLVGESGCGKSSLGRALLRLVPVSGGRVEFLGQDLTKLGTRQLRRMRREMQIVFQDPRGSLDPRMTVEEIIGEPLRVHEMAAGAAKAALVREMLDKVGLDRKHVHRRPSELSGGQQQRVGIARALVTGPKLVVCDEPISALDVSIQAQVVNVLQDLRDEFGVAYLFIAHNLAVVRHLSDRVAVMYLGRIVEEAPAHDLFARPLHPYTQGLIAAVPRPDLDARVRLGAVQRLVAGELPSLLNPPKGCRYNTRCPFAQDRCREETPVLEEVPAEDGTVRRVACHFWRDIDELPPEAQAR